MKALRYIFKTVLWSAGVAVGIRIVFGLYSVFGSVVLLIPAGVAIAAAFSLATASNGGLTAVSMLHIILTAVFYGFFDFSGLFVSLPSDSANFFARFASEGDPRVNILWCIMFVMPVYFLCYIVFSGIITSVKKRRRYLGIEEDQYEEEDEESLSYTE